MRLKLLIGLSSTTIAMGLTISTVYADATSYVVKRGDSLYNIARSYGESVSELKSQNNLKSNMIYPGERLKVGSGSSSSTASHSSHTSSVTSKTYTVVSGDTLWGISHKMGVSLSRLESWNHLSSSSVLHIGEKLEVKSGVMTKLSGRSSTPNNNVAQAAQGESVVSFAKQFLGVPYVWGGTSPRGFDCSGFVQFVYAHFGISLPRTSYAQYGTGTWISESDLQPGDILFFDTYGSGASHDGIYVGNGEFINAASNRVEIDRLHSRYWSDHYVGAKRV